MLTYMLNKPPAYMDDRLTFEIFLSDQLEYSSSSYSFATPPQTSSWYNEDADWAYTATKMEDVPERYRDSLVQWGTAGTGSTYMAPLKSQARAIEDTTKTFTFSFTPGFSGDSFSICWDAENQSDQQLSVYRRGVQLSDFPHTYEEYGRHVIKFSSNVISVGVTRPYINQANDDGVPDDQVNKITSITSRSKNLEYIGRLAYCRKLKQITLHNVLSSVDQWYDCYDLTSISLPDCVELDKMFGMNCMFNLRKFDAPRLQRFNLYAAGDNDARGGMFKGNAKLEEAVFPQLTAILASKGYNFQGCTSLSTAYMPRLVQASPREFDGCVNLKNTDFSSLSAVTDSMFQLCISLKSIKLPSVKSIGATAFNKCVNLRTVDLRGVRQVPALASANAFGGLPPGYRILVDEDMVAAFKAATNWKNSAVVNHITASQD